MIYPYVVEYDRASARATLIRDVRGFDSLQDVGDPRAVKWDFESLDEARDFLAEFPPDVTRGEMLSEREVALVRRLEWQAAGLRSSLLATEIQLRHLEPGNS